MALQKQLVNINVTGSEDTKGDEYLGGPDRFDELVNFEFADDSTVQTRGAQNQLSFNATGVYTAPVSARRAFPHKDSMLVESPGSAAYLYDLSKFNDTVLNVRGIPPALQVADGTVTTVLEAGVHVRPRAGMQTRRVGSAANQVMASPGDGGSYDCCVMSGGTRVAYVWEEAASEDSEAAGTTNIRLQYVDETTGVVIVDRWLYPELDGTQCKPRIIDRGVDQHHIYFAGYSTGDTSYSILHFTLGIDGDVSGPHTVASIPLVGAVEGPANNECIFDIALSSDGLKLSLVAYAESGNVLRFYQLDTSDGYTTTLLKSVAPTAHPLSISVAISLAAGVYKTHAFYSIGTNVLRGTLYNHTTTADISEAVLTAVASEVIRRITTALSGAYTVLIACDATTVAPAGGLETNVVHLASWAAAIGTRSESKMRTQWYIGGKLLIAAAKIYLPLMHLSESYNSTMFLSEVTEFFAESRISTITSQEAPHVLARIDYGELAITPSKNWSTGMRVPGMGILSDGTLVLPYLKYEANTRLAGTDDITQSTLCAARIDLLSQLGHAELNGVTFLAGACPMIYDGASYVEEGFHHAPEIIDIGTPAAAPTTQGYGVYAFPNATKTYSVCFTQSWVDAQGNFHESAPSAETTVSITAGANLSIAPTLVLPSTQKQGVRLNMYRTLGSSTDTSMYLASPYASSGFAITDANLISSEQLYTAGNVLPNTPAPSCRQVTAFQRRLVLAGCGDGQALHWSKVATEGYGVEFASSDVTHRTRVPAAQGRAAAVVDKEDKIHVFCEKGVGVIYGQGPAPTGTAGQYSDFQLLTSEAGAIWTAPNSVVSAPEGIWAQTPQGVRLFRGTSFARAQDGRYIGAEQDRRIVSDVTTLVCPLKQQVRFYQVYNTGAAVFVPVWSSQWQKWTSFGNLFNDCACYVGGRFYTLVDVAGALAACYTNDDSSNETSASPGDATVTTGALASVFSTSWLSFAGVQGFSRAYRMNVLGKRSTSTGSSTTVTLEGFLYRNYDQSINESFTGVMTLQPGALAQRQHHIAGQKCESMKITLQVTPSITAGKFRLTNLTLQVGIKTGMFKLPSSSRF